MKALVVGGKGDIGKSIVTKLQGLGYDVIETNSQDLDLSSILSIEKFIKKHTNNFDIVVHSAGYNVPAEFSELPFEEFRKSMEINFMGFSKLLQLIIPYMINNKRTSYITVVSSLYGFSARNGRIGYTTSKHALNGLVKTLAIELGPHNILVNSVSPGYIETRMTKKNNSAEIIKKLTSKIPLKRLGVPEDIAEVVSFISSSKNKYINGQDIIIDGGYSIGGYQSYD